MCAEVRPSNSFLSTPEKKRETKNMFRVLNPNRFGALCLKSARGKHVTTGEIRREKRTRSMLPERNDVISEEDEEEEDEDEFQMLERLTREIDGLAAPTMTSSREYSSPLRESIKAFVGKSHGHHIPRGNALNSGGSGGFPSKKNTNSNNTTRMVRGAKTKRGSRVQLATR